MLAGRPGAGKSPDQIREAFRLPDDLTEEEKLEPLRTVAGALPLLLARALLLSPPLSFFLSLSLSLPLPGGY